MDKLLEYNVNLYIKHFTSCQVYAESSKVAATSDRKGSPAQRVNLFSRLSLLVHTRYLLRTRKSAPRSNCVKDSPSEEREDRKMARWKQG